MDNKTKYEYEMIDGNYTVHPVAECKHYKKALTAKMMRTHKCEDRNCKCLNKNYKFV